MTYVLVIILNTGAFVMPNVMAVHTCVEIGQRITARHHAEMKRGDDPTYRGFIRAHCERVSP